MRDKKLTYETRSIVVMRQVSLGMVLLSYCAGSASALFSECEGILQRILPQLTDTAARAANVAFAL